MASNAENVSIWWRHHGLKWINLRWSHSSLAFEFLVWGTHTRCAPGWRPFVLYILFNIQQSSGSSSVRGLGCQNSLGPSTAKNKTYLANFFTGVNGRNPIHMHKYTHRNKSDSLLNNDNSITRNWMLKIQDLFLAATKQLNEWYFPSVCPSVRLSVRHTFLTMFPSSDHHEIFRSGYKWQKWCPCKRSRSEVKGQGHRGHDPI